MAGSTQQGSDVLSSQTGTPAQSYLMNRRTFFGLSGVALAATALAACSTEVPQGWEGGTRALPIPPEMRGTANGNRSTFALVAQHGSSEITPGVKTPTMGFNGPHLGPTLRMSRGEQIEITVESQLKEITAVHWHGMKVPAIADGGPHSPITPGGTWTANFTVEQPAATLWYHPHPHGATGVQAYRGLAGMLIVDDEVESGLDLPRTYGVDDIPVVLQDANFTADGAFDETLDPNLGLQGKVITVNGITNPHFDATTDKLRLRLINGSNMRFHNVGLKSGESFQVIASDSGLLEAGIDAEAVALGPGERAEIVLQLEPGKEYELYSLGFEDRLGVPDDEFAPDFLLDTQALLLTIRTADTLDARAAVPEVLDRAASEILPEAEVAELPLRAFVLNTFQINGEDMDMLRVDEVVDHEGPEVWEVSNQNSDWLHNFHIHNARFKVLALEDTTVAINDSGWKDTVTLPPNSTVRLLVEFGYFPDPKWPYMYHCHMLFHEDSGMMGQYVVVEAGQEPALETDYTEGEHQH
nr:multicopper oxidase domain-containing protein [Corynebacterium sp. 1222RC1]